MSHTHRDGGPVCKFRTMKACDEAFRLWEDDRYIALAAKAATGPMLVYHRRGSGMYSQVVRMLAGTQRDLWNEEGNPHKSALAVRLRAAIERHRAAITAAEEVY